MGDTNQRILRRSKSCAEASAQPRAQEGFGLFTLEIPCLTKTVLLLSLLNIHAHWDILVPVQFLILTPNAGRRFGSAKSPSECSVSQ